MAQVGELGVVGQAAIPEQERRGLERALVRQLLRVVTAIDQATVLAIDERDLGLAQLNPLQARRAQLAHAALSAHATVPAVAPCGGTAPPSQHTVSVEPVLGTGFKSRVRGRGARSERERIPARRSGRNPFKSRDPSREAPGPLGTLSGPG